MSVQKKDHGSVKVMLAGKSGTGKTTLLEKIIKRERAKFVFIYDHKHAADGGDLAERFGVRPCYYGDDLTKALMRGGFVAFNPFEQLEAGIIRDKSEGLEFFCQWLWEVCQGIRGKKLFIVDELQSLVDTDTEPGTLIKILDEGRSYQIDCYFGATAVNGIHNRVRNQFTELFAFTQGDDRAADFFKKFGFDAKELVNLPNGQWLYKNLTTGKTTKGGKSFTPKNSERDLRGL